MERGFKPRCAWPFHPLNDEFRSIHFQRPIASVIKRRTRELTSLTKQQEEEEEDLTFEDGGDRGWIRWLGYRVLRTITKPSCFPFPPCLSARSSINCWLILVEYVRSRIYGRFMRRLCVGKTISRRLCFRFILVPVLASHSSYAIVSRDLFVVVLRERLTNGPPLVFVRCCGFGIEGIVASRPIE